jgi:Ca2+-binding EF-hand superfamily protein
VKSIRVFAGLVAVLAGAGVASAQTQASAPSQQPGPVPRTVFIQTMDAEFKQQDADKNGILTKKEIEDFQRATSALVAQQRNVAFFQALDKDKNGQLTAAEFAALPMSVPKPNAVPVFAQTDANRDGQVTAVEYRAGKLRNFDNMDTDKDGTVTAAEMKAAGLIK